MDSPARTREQLRQDGKNGAGSRHIWSDVFQRKQKKSSSEEAGHSLEEISSESDLKGYV